RIFSKTIPIFTTDKKVKLFNVCSGTEAPSAALSMLTGGCVNHLASCDVNADCRLFVLANSKPKHLNNDVADFLKPKAFCYTCQAQCSTFAEEEPDFYVGGFPCQPYSNLKPKRWTSEYQPFKTPEAKVFLDISKYLRHNIKKPRVVILESVYGLLLRNKSGCAPIEVIMGVVLRYGRLEV
ncbi:MAG: DNA cytosine methyltransferase, partial [Candidatus Fonsibacter sp.]